MMVDYLIGEDFDLQRTAWNDFETVDGLDEFEQDVAINIHFKMRQLMQDTSGAKTDREKIRAVVYRVASEYSILDEIKTVQVSRIFDGESKYRVEITYITSEAFSETF